MKQPSDYAFWKALKSIGPRKLFLCWDFEWALLISTVGVYFYTSYIPRVANHVAIAGDFVALTGALFGVVIAGLAIVSTVLDRKYARFIVNAEGSVYNLLRHFVVDGGLLIMAITSGIVYRSIAPKTHHLSPALEYSLFGLTVFLFFWALFGAFQILKLLFAVADVGAAVIAAPDADESDQKAS